MIKETVAQKGNESRSHSRDFHRVIMGNDNDTDQGNQKLYSRLRNDSSPMRKPVETTRQISGTAEKWTEQDTHAFPGNTLGYRSRSPSSAEGEIEKSPGSSVGSPRARDYWETVLGPSSNGEMSGNTNPLPNGTEEKPYQCSICPSSFKKRCNLLTHISNVHEKIRPFVCSICYRRFARKSNCVKHMKLVHRIPRERIEVLETKDTGN